MYGRGEIFWGSVLKEHTKGHEQHNEGDLPRLWLIVSDGRLVTTKMVIACPITSKAKNDERLESFRTAITPDLVSKTPTDDNTQVEGVILGDQIRAMSTERFSGKRVGKLKPDALADVEVALMLVLQIGK